MTPSTEKLTFLKFNFVFCFLVPEFQGEPENIAVEKCKVAVKEVWNDYGMIHNLADISRIILLLCCRHYVTFLTDTLNVIHFKIKKMLHSC